MTNWQSWHARGFGLELVPVIPHDAKIAAGSSVQESMRGKTPGLRRDDGCWVGLGGSWSKDLFPKAKTHLQKWMKMGAHVGMQGRKIPGVDIDVNKEAVARAIQDLAFDILGEAPVRWRKKSPRRLLPYRCEGLRKRRITFMVDGEVQAVELLGDGQYYNVDAIHPSGEPYRWSDKEFKVDSLAEITKELVDKFFAALVDYLEMMGYEIVKQSSAGNASGTRKSLDNKALHAPASEDVLAILKAVPCDAEAFPERDDFVRVLPAIKAALGPDRDEHWPDVLDWALGYPGAEEEYITKIWESIKDAELGWSFLLAWAQGHGYAGQAQKDFDEGVDDNMEHALKQLPDNHPMKETALEKAQKGTVFCYEQDKFFDMTTGAPLSSNAFNAKHTGVAAFGNTGKKSASAIFMNHGNSTKVDRLTYLVGVRDRVVTMPDGTTAFNQWSPGPMVPTPGRDVQPWLNHMELIFGPPGSEASNHILDYMAHLVQRRGVKVNHAVVLYGETQGTGKDTCLVPLTRFLGSDNVEGISPERVLSQFNGFLRNELIIINEMVNFEKLVVMNRMKEWLATPPDTLSINPKFMKPYNIPNAVNVIITTNYGDAVRMDNTDRRFWVHEVLLTEPLEEAYYAGLHKWYSDGGCEAVIGWLMGRDISAFNPKASPPITDAKRAMIADSLPKEAQQLLRLFDEGEALNSRMLMTTRELLNHARVNEGINATEHHATMVMKQLGWSPTKRVRLNGAKESPARVWCQSRDTLAHDPHTIARMYREDVKAGEASHHA